MKEEKKELNYMEWLSKGIKEIESDYNLTSDGVRNALILRLCLCMENFNILFKNGIESLQKSKEVGKNEQKTE